jgi:hypothetical protein
MDITGGASGSGGGGAAPKLTVVTPAMSPYALADDDTALAIVADSGHVVIQLPSGAAPNRGRRIPWIRLDFTDAFVVQFAPAPGENINGQGALIVVNPAASFCGGDLLAIGDDGIGFINGWASLTNANGQWITIAGPALVPAVQLMKLGSYARSVEPYVRGFYHAGFEVVNVTNFQLQSYHSAIAVNTDAASMAILLNGANGLGQQHLVANVGANTLTVVPNGADVIHGGALVLASGEAAMLITAGAGVWYPFKIGA